ncbi:hypothetical protein SBV1_370025 [Verrucomicrobia bacterium]|nr:hypothetical protein SBV1_370025 [Verrucomicrobiota bacterium]
MSGVRRKNGSPEPIPFRKKAKRSLPFLTKRAFWQLAALTVNPIGRVVCAVSMCAARKEEKESAGNWCCRFSISPAATTRRQLVLQVLDFASRYYSQVGLRCDTTAADRFYVAVGFSRTDSDPRLTHVIELNK